MKKTLLVSASLALTIFTVGLVFSGGGHGWGTDLFEVAFWPASHLVAILDSRVRSGYARFEHPNDEYEIFMIVVHASIVMMWYVFLGFTIHFAYKRIRS
ncbi:MAG: hypothetical protein HY507_00420 [Candidatus Zambryskibacteria bacterium]|nr:hypothetical protein [Candidatus Zambryskibacteria bacterium]